MTEAAPEELTDRVAQIWPSEVKIAAQEMGKKLKPTQNLTEFTVEAVRQRLSGEDRFIGLEREVGELRYLCQLLADRVAMGGEHDDRTHLLMEVELPSWMKTDGWPSDMKGLVPLTPPTVEKVAASFKEVTEAVLDRVTPGEPAQEVATGGSAEVDREAAPGFVPPTGQYSREELSKPAHQVAAEKMQIVEDPTLAEIGEDKPLIVPPGGFQVGDQVEVGGIEFTKIGEDPFGGGDDDLFERVKATAAAKGIDVSGAGLVPASKVPVPPKPDGNPHNHAWERVDGILCCECGAWIEETTEYPQGIVRDENHPRPAVEVPTEPAPALEVQTPVPTPVAPAPARDLSDIDVDF